MARISVTSLLAAAVFAVSTAAFAFQEQQGTPSAPAPAAKQPSAGVSEVPPASKEDDGTEIRIPGLGKLGVLPKMDFGLELLYGAADPKVDEPTTPGKTDPDSDLSIRGTIKHKF